MDGSIDALSAVQMNKNVEGLDASAKYILKQKEFLSVILHLAVPEYEDYTQEEIMGFIEGSTISVGETELSNHQTNTVVSGENTEFKILNEKVSYFDILFKAVNPILSDQSEIAVNLHINIEPQLNYKPGYPIEKRGIY